MKALLSALLLTAGLIGCSSSGGTGGGSGGGAGGGSGGSTGGGSGGGTGGAGGGTVSGFNCTTATLFAGNPLHTSPMMRPADGTGLLEDPPFAYRTIVFSNGQMITHNGQEIWRANLTDKKLHKLAGTESQQQALITGACASARFANIFSIALASDGSLFVSDQTGNTILKVTDPLGAGCMVSHYAGTPMDIAAGGLNPNMIPNVGKTDGPGATAKFSLPERMALDSSDNIYVWDQANDSIRKIANDASHTVSTIATSIGSGGGSLLSEVFLDGKLYVWGKASNDLFLTALDPVTGTKTDLVRGRSDKFGGSSADSQILGGIVTDGTALIVFFNGQFFRITKAGVISAPLAGTYRPGVDYMGTYDPKVPHPAAQLQIADNVAAAAVAGAYSYLAIDSSSDLYFSGLKTNNYVISIACSP